MKLKRVCFAALLSLCMAGCLFPRYGEPTVIDAATDVPEVSALSAPRAKEIIDNALANPPAGHHPNNPGWLNLGRRATAVRLRVHNRTGLILVEVMDGQRRMMEFYVNNLAEGQEFANALWRAKLEDAAAK